MLDPLTAVSLAGTVVQFVEFATSVFSKTRELKNTLAASGEAEGRSNYAVLTKDLQCVSEKLKGEISALDPNALQSEDDRALEEVCNGCIKMSEKMLKRLNSLTVRDGDGGLKIMLQATRSIWSRKELDDMATDLATFRTQLQLRVFMSFKQKLDLAALSREPGLTESSQHVIVALRDHREIFRDTVHQQTEAIVALHQELQQVTIDEHEKTRSVIVDAVNKAGNLILLDQEPVEGKIRRPVFKKKWKSPEKQELEYKQKAETRILRSLTFPSITARYSQVSQAHQQTFEWIFQDPRIEDRTWSNFTEWLQSDNRIYWISGKAGSGKSTLMRYLYDHSMTRELLSSWSGSLPLEIASFFFWNSGTTDQKSQIGLLRSILHTILLKHRDLIPIILPDQWRDEYIHPTEYMTVFRWDLETLGKACELLRTQDKIRICLFIDGLDEYEGDRDGTHVEIVKLFKTIAESCNIKVCLSSRPWLVFEDAFSIVPSLRLQDLTSNDITRYIEDTLGEHAKMKQLREVDSENAEALIDEIVTKASGVFLWVILVVKSLLDGLTNRDRVSDLQRRLRMLPADLEDLYKHMLFKHISSFYHEQASQIFQIVRATKSREYHTPEQLTLLTLAFANEEDNMLAVTARVDPLTDEEILYKCSEMSDRLKSRCAGLLEVSGKQSNPYDLKINYLHRTVQDFLALPNIWTDLESRTNNSFDPDRCLLQSYLLQLKLVPRSNPYGHVVDIPGVTMNALKFARRSRDKTHAANVQILDELDKTMTYYWCTNQNEPNRSLREAGQHWAVGMDYTSTPHDNFLTLAVEFGLAEYIEAKLERNVNLLKTKVGRPYLDYLDNRQGLECLPETVAVLLKYGANPNETHDSNENAWQFVLNSVPVRSEGSQNHDATTLEHSPWRAIIKLFLQAGADPHILVQKTRNHGLEGSIDMQASSAEWIHVATPLGIVSSSGPLPDPELEEYLESQGAVATHAAFKKDINTYSEEERFKTLIAPYLRKHPPRHPQKELPVMEQSDPFPRTVSPYQSLDDSASSSFVTPIPQAFKADVKKKRFSLRAFTRKGGKALRRS